MEEEQERIVSKKKEIERLLKKMTIEQLDEFEIITVNKNAINCPSDK